MGLFDRTAKYLAAGPTLLVPANRVDDVGELLHRYDPHVKVKNDRFFFDNGVFLYGPVETSEPGIVGYYARPAWLPKHEDRAESAKLLDGERLVRGLAVRLNGGKQSEQPWADLDLGVSVYAATSLPVEQVIAILQPFAGDEAGRELVVDDEGADDYILGSYLEPVFLTVFWPAYLSKAREARPALATGATRKQEMCRWELRTAPHAATADLALCRLLAEAALALAAPTNGIVVDMYGFPITTPDELLPS
ncbi:MAG TPA: hypothetical protein VH333_21575 [Pseudonocardiaceae bacterium]|jgi:hypothetical protein|nr:hypothetical protein [Pseudonocardiaceae bacterium]